MKALRKWHPHFFPPIVFFYTSPFVLCFSAHLVFFFCSDSPKQLPPYTFFCHLFDLKHAVASPFKFLYLYYFMHMSVWLEYMYVFHALSSSSWNPELFIRFLVLKLQKLVSHYVGATKLKTSSSITSTFNHWTISPPLPSSSYWT